MLLIKKTVSWKKFVTVVFNESKFLQPVKDAAKIQKISNISIWYLKNQKKVINLQAQKVNRINNKQYKPMKKLLSLTLLALCLTFCQYVFAQVNSGILPQSAVAQLTESTVPQYDVTTPDLAALQTKAETSIQNGTPLKVAVVMPLQLTTDNAGLWESTDDGYDIWRLKLHNAKALGCCVLFDRFALPEGAQFFAYNNDKSLIYGPYTKEDNLSGEGFSSGLFAEGDVILEYVSPKHQLNQIETPDILIAGYTYFYRSEGLPDLRVNEAKSDEYGSSQSCMININCSEGDNWRTQQKGVGRMLSYVVEDGQLGAGWCSGTLINNTMGDGTPYFLSANHCADGAATNYYNYFEFYFHYECPYCTCTSEPGMITYTGCTKIANSPISGGSDFLLLKLKNANWSKLKTDGLVLNGWSKSATPSSSGVGIHHPAGDVKKISTYTSTLSSGTFNNGATNAYWDVGWAQTTHGRSVTEGGSSGSPLFNSAGLVVGTLTGGSSSCSNPYGHELYGKVSYHWTSAGTTNDKRLQPWLDPVPLSQTTCNLLDLNGSFYVMPAAHIFSANGATYNYIIFSNQAWTLTYQNDHSWLTVNTESGNGDGAIQVNCQANPTTSTRRCNLLITRTDGSTFQVVVKQEASGTGVSVVPEEEFSVYPNPAHNEINIESVEHFISKVEIIDMLGKVVYSYSNNGANSLIIPTSQLDNAMYLLRMTTVNNEVVYKKFTKN